MRFILLAGALLISVASAAFSQDAAEIAPIPSRVAETADRLMEQALVDTVGLDFVEDLTTEVGQRLAGSQAEKRARDWAESELTTLGFRNVRVEPFEIPFWSRVSERAQIVAPTPQQLVITALGGSASTPKGGVTAEIIRYPSLAALEVGFRNEIRDKIVFIDEDMTRTQDGSGYGLAVRKRSRCAAVAAEKGAAACLIRSVGTQRHRMPHTGIMARPDGEATGALPAAALSQPDADQLARLLERGPVTINLDIQTETFNGVPSGNVVGEIIGQRKNEIILLGCHLDSWDLGTGALDDGAGCGIVIGAAKLIDALPGKPKRTIRVVLYGAEEVGLLGADAYARRHADELDKHVLAAESDFGAGRVWKFQTRFGEGALPYADAIKETLAVLGVTPGGNDAHGGPDIGVLRHAGVPVVTAAQDGTDYFDYHHTPDDTFDKIVPHDFRQNVAVYAAFAYIASETGWDFRKPAAPEDEAEE